MNAAERKELRRATVLLVSGDRTGALAVIRALNESPRQAPDDSSAQLVLPCVTFRCHRLSTDNLPVIVCVTRQRVTDLQRTQQASRGQGTDYPLCDTRTCDQGRYYRERLNPNAPMAWQGAGPGGRFERGRTRAVPTVDEEV